MKRALEREYGNTGVWHCIDGERIEGVHIDQLIID
jgi:hypothetical protein